ncbi:uncharacterized protein [Euwallacea similis]|uniref:uncharacterized protein n=1 Tax=Euwallacea similis TaxID=1736056 RepID=UPI00344FD84F
MELILNLNPTNPKLSYYNQGKQPIVDEFYTLLGFNNNLPVLTSALSSSGAGTKLKSKIKMLKSSSISTSNVSKVQVDEHGEKFIELNGQKLKVVPEGQIPKEVRKRTFLLKQQLINSGLKSPLQVHVVGNGITDKDKVMKIKLIKTKITNSIQTAISGDTSQPVNSPVFSSVDSMKPTELKLESFSDSDISETLPVFKVTKVVKSYDKKHIIASTVPNKKTKLLTAANLKILNQVKMQALNLSTKRDENSELKLKQYTNKKHNQSIEVQTDPHEPEEVQEDISAPKAKRYKNLHNVSIGVQTDWGQKKFNNQMVQTDVQNLIPLFEPTNFFDSPLDDMDQYCKVMLSDVNFGVGPSMSKIASKFIQMDGGPLGSSSTLSSSASSSVKQDNNDLMRKKLMFFTDLKECLTYNTEGNLPLHEGVIHNELGLVKRHCAALKARKVGVNLETHNGCTPLQLAIIHNAQGVIVKTLLDYGADLKDVDGEGNNILHLGAMFERHEALAIILVHKSFELCSHCINDYNFEGLTPLMICCTRGWAAGVLLFIGNKANVNCRDQTSGRTALFHAAEAQNTQIVKLLLDHHADPKVKNFFGTSPHDAMYELEDMPETIKGLIFGRTKKRCIEAEMNPCRTAKAAKSLKTYPKLQKVSQKTGTFATPQVRYPMEQKIK